MDLLERTGQLEQLRDALGSAARGEGRLVLLGGEAGIGKTTLVKALGREAESSARVEVVSWDGMTMPGPLGPFFEIAHILGPDVERLLAGEAPRDQLFRAVLSALARPARTLVLIGEDAHWTDEASIDLIRFLFSVPAED